MILEIEKYSYRTYGNLKHKKTSPKLGEVFYIIWFFSSYNELT